MNGAPDPEVLNRALLELAKGEPDWVLVDRRVLQLLLGPLSDLLVQIPYGGKLNPRRYGGPQLVRDYDPDQDGYAWDGDDVC
jgi:hypothetical protein